MQVYTYIQGWAKYLKKIIQVQDTRYIILQPDTTRKINIKFKKKTVDTFFLYLKILDTVSSIQNILLKTTIIVSKQRQMAIAERQNIVYLGIKNQIMLYYIVIYNYYNLKNVNKIP